VAQKLLSDLIRFHLLPDRRHLPSDCLLVGRREILLAHGLLYHVAIMRALFNAHSMIGNGQGDDVVGRRPITRRLSHPAGCLGTAFWSAFLKKYSKAGANRPTTQKEKARDPLEITGLFWLREPDLN
jgi:hypothetical protein